MTVMEAIHEIDCLRPNTFSQEQKIQWLDRLDSFVRAMILTRYPAKKADLLNLGDPDRVLLMEAPFDEGYLYWLESKIHYFNEEIDRYNSAVRMFRNLFEDYQRHLHQQAEPESPGVFKI